MFSINGRLFLNSSIRDEYARNRRLKTVSLKKKEEKMSFLFPLFQWVLERVCLGVWAARLDMMFQTQREVLFEFPRNNSSLSGP